MPGALPVIGLALGLGGTLMQYNAGQQAADTAQTFSLLNAQAGVQAATQQGSVAALQSQLQAQQAATAQQAAQGNAEAMRAQAEQDAKISQETIRRNRDDFARQLAAATAQQGASGAVLATGSGLDFLIHAADAEKATEEDASYQANASRVMGYRQAAGEELQGRVQGLNESLYQIQSIAAIDESRARATQAKLGGLAGAAQATGMRNSAFGNLIEGAAGNLNSFASSPWGRKLFG